MFRRIFAAALGAGIGVGLLIAAIQHVSLVPMIFQAEKYESGAVVPHQHEHGAMPALVGQAHAHEDHGAPMVAEDSPWRPVFTWIATTLTAVGYALLLVGAFAVSGRAGRRPRGPAVGLAGFAAFALAPAFGLPPELPGSVAADLLLRQSWWIATMAATALALGLLVFARAAWAIPVGIALLAAPHVDRRAASGGRRGTCSARTRRRVCGAFAWRQRGILGSARLGDRSALCPLRPLRARLTAARLCARSSSAAPAPARAAMPRA